MDYAYVSELMRTSVWAMYPDMFAFYKERILNGIRDRSLSGTEWTELRGKSALILHRPGESSLDTRLLQTQSIANLDNCGDIESEDRIIHQIPLTGPITHAGTPCSWGTLQMADQFRYADEHPNVVGHLVIIDTPGGSALADDLNEVFANARKPVVGLIRGMNASKGVWISSFIPYVFAEYPSVQIGSVGAYFSVYGYRNGLIKDNMYSFEVYADHSKMKNIAYREAIQNDNLDPAKKLVNEIEERFRADVRKRWPNVPDDRLTGDMYDASEVVGQLVDGIKSYHDCVIYLFELAGVEGISGKLVTPIGTLERGEDDDTPNDDSDDLSTQARAEIEDTATQASDNINPQNTLTPMSNVQALEAILGEGSVQVDADGNVQLTTGQIEKLNAHYASGQSAQNMVATQATLIDKLRKESESKDATIEEMSRMTGKPVERVTPPNDNAPEAKIVIVDGPVTSGNINNYKADLGTMRKIMEANGLMS